MLLACSTGATNQHLINETHSSSQFTGGTTTADPTATASTFRTYTNAQYLKSPVVNVHYHVMYSTSGDVLFFTSTDAAGFPQFGGGYCLLVNSEAGVNYPCIAFTAFNSSTPGGMTVSNLGGSSNATLWMQDGLITTTGGVAQYQTAFGQTWPAQFNGTQGTYASISKWLLLPAVVFAQGTPSGGSATAGFAGVLVDVSLAPTGTNTTQATEEPASPATSTTAKFGEFMVPNGGTTPVF